MDKKTASVYTRAGLGQRIQTGSRPAVLVVDLIYGFTDPNCPLGTDLTDEVHATRTVLDEARTHGFPVIFTTIAYEPNLKDSGLWIQKIPALKVLQIGRREVEVDSRLNRTASESLVVKKGPSALFGTNVASMLTSQQVDTVVLCRATTSGCIRATAVDLLQYGFATLVPRECVGDRARSPHEANLIDIDAKYGTVTSLKATLTYLRTTATSQDEA